MKDFIANALYESAVTVEPRHAILHMLVALILGFVIYLVYKYTFNGAAYSKKFNITLIMLSLITTMVMNILGNSIALSLGMVGALSIVRFRTAIKDPRDTAYIFWAITVGLGAGSGNYFMVILGTLVIAIVAFVVNKGIKEDDSYILIIRCNGKAAEEVRRNVVHLFPVCRTRSETVTDEYIEMVYQVKLKKNSKASNCERIQRIEGVTFTSLVARNGETLG